LLKVTNTELMSAVFDTLLRKLIAYCPLAECVHMANYIIIIIMLTEVAALSNILGNSKLNKIIFNNWSY